ncbi:MAG: hypothetical protein LBG66_01735 [Gallionellaceae bacterium]|jgi:hypothetical protein|nr:hypothetical protein [Gallionellaceae bacterium]
MVKLVNFRETEAGKRRVEAVLLELVGLSFRDADDVLYAVSGYLDGQQSSAIFFNLPEKSNDAS